MVEETKMRNNTKYGEAGNSADCSILPLDREVAGGREGGAVDYLKFVDNVHVVLKRGGEERRNAQPMPKELRGVEERGS